MNIFGGFGDPYSFSQALGGQPTYQQQVNRQAGQIVSAIGSKLPSVAGQVARAVGNIVTNVASASPAITYGPSTTTRNAQGQYVTHTSFAMEKGGLIGSGRGSIAPWYYREKGGKIKKNKKKKSK